MKHSILLNRAAQSALIAFLSLSGTSLMAQTTATISATGAAASSTAAPVEPGVAIPIRYKLAKAGKVSINIYDGKGAVVRELLHVAARQAGENLDVWDGLDNDGKPVPAAPYSWKMLSTPGLGAEYLMSVGSNYPVQAESVQQAYAVDNAPGTHVGPSAVFADSSGIYVAAGNENIEPATVKISLDGKKKLWNAPWPGVYQRLAAMCRIGDKLWGLTTAGAISYVPDLGHRSHAPNQPWNPHPAIGGPMVQNSDKQYASDITSDGDYLVMSFAAGKLSPGIVRWYDTKTYKLETEIPFPNAIALASDGKSAVYISNGTAIYRVSRAAPEPVKIIDDLKQARCMTVDAPTGDILIFDGGPYGGGDSQVKRYSKDGKFMRAYGKQGGRSYGLYTTEAQQSFNGVSDIEAMPGGGFIISEPNTAPRRTAHFDAEGKLVREWYGGQVWAPWVQPEPDNPNALWMASSWNSFMRCTLDYRSKTWKVHSTYPYAANSVMTANGNPSSIGFGVEARMHNGELYLAWDTGGYPKIMRVDRKNWKMMPVVAMWANVPFTIQQGQSAQIPAMILAAAATRPRNDPNGMAVWTDGDGDGQPQEAEIQWAASSFINGGMMDKDFNLYTLWPKHLGGIMVSGWNAAGAPLYDLSTTMLKRVGPNLPAREGGGGGYIIRDTETSDFFSARNYHTAWAVSKDSFLTKLRPDGTLVWTVGRVGGQVGTIGYFRRIFGFVNGCVAAVNTTEGFPRTYVWDRDGLFAGGLFDTVKLDGIHEGRYHLGAESINGMLVKNQQTGEVLLYAHWTNEIRIYRITGWEGWERESGSLELKQPAGTGSNGLIAAFHRADGTRIGQWIVSSPTFSPDQLKSATSRQVAASGQYLVRMTGQIAAPADGEYNFSTKGPGDVHLVAGNYVAIDRWKGSNMAAPIKMVANQRVAFQLEYMPSGNDEGVQLLWNLAGQQPAPVPTSALFIVADTRELPFGHGTGIRGKYYVAWLPGGGLKPGETLPAPKITRIDPLIDIRWNKGAEPENAPILGPDGRPTYVVHWKGYFVPRDSGLSSIFMWPSYTAAQFRFNGAAAPTNSSVSVDLQAGKKYPIEVYYSSFYHGHLGPPKERNFQLRVSGPRQQFEIIPQSQLFPAED